MNVRENISSNIKFLRKKQGVSQLAMAEDFECSNTTISNWEVGIRIPEVVDLPKIASYFGISIDDLLTQDLQLNYINGHDTNKNEKAILDNIRLLTPEEQEKVLAMIDLIKK